MKLSSLFTLLATISILTVPTFAQDAIRPNPQVEAKAAQALVDYENNVLHFTKDTSYSVEGYYIHQLNDVAISLARLGRTKRALEAVDNIDNYLDSVSDRSQQTRQRVLRLAVHRSAKFGHTDNVAQLIPQIKQPMDQADALLYLARAYLRKRDYQAARKVLLQASPLVKESAQATAYTASLLSQAGDMAAAKRLFAKALKNLPSLPPGLSRPIPDDVPKNYRDNPKTLGYLLEAGFVKEWWNAYQQHNSANHLFVSMESINQLLALHHTDMAIQLAHSASTINKPAFLIDIALQLPKDKAGVEQSKSLLSEAEEMYRAMQKKFTAITPDESKEGQRATKERQSMLRSFAMFIAYGYSQIDDKPAAQKWIEVATDGLSLDEAATWHVLYLMMSFTVQREFHINQSVTPSMIIEINKEIAPYLSRLDDPEIDFYPLKHLAEEQIKVGQFEQARPNLGVLEKLIRKNMDQASPSPIFFDFNDAMQTVKLWKEIGDDTRAQKLLSYIWQAPIQEPKTKAERAQWFISNGFIDQGIKHLKSQPEESDKTGYYLILATAEAEYRPNTFPDWITQIETPVNRLRIIASFVGTLTNPVFQNNLVLTRDGRFGRTGSIGTYADLMTW